MIHAQLRTRYPSCPFLTNIGNINKSSSQIFDENNKISSSDLIKTMMSYINVYDHNSNIIKDFISQYSDLNANEFIDNVYWAQIKQSIRELDFSAVFV